MLPKDLGPSSHMTPALPTGLERQQINRLLRTRIYNAHLCQPVQQEAENTPSIERSVQIEEKDICWILPPASLAK